MDAEALKKFREEVLERLDTDKNINDIKLQVGRLVSHYESEVDNRQIMVEKLKEIDKELAGTASTVGLRTKVKTVEDYLLERKKQNNAIFLCVIGLVLKSGWEIIQSALQHKP